MFSVSVGDNQPIIPKAAWYPCEHKMKHKKMFPKWETKQEYFVHVFQEDGIRASFCRQHLVTRKKYQVTGKADALSKQAMSLTTWQCDTELRISQGFLNVKRVSLDSVWKSSCTKHTWSTESLFKDWKPVFKEGQSLRKQSLTGQLHNPLQSAHAADENIQLEATWANAPNQTIRPRQSVLRHTFACLNKLAEYQLIISVKKSGATRLNSLKMHSISFGAHENTGNFFLTHSAVGGSTSVFRMPCWQN